MLHRLMTVSEPKGEKICDSMEHCASCNVHKRCLQVLITDTPADKHSWCYHLRCV